MSTSESRSNDELIARIKDPSNTHGREAARAELDELLVKKLTDSLARLGSELSETRKEMKASASVASDYQGALVLWTIILSITTVAYAVAAFLPFIRPPEREWVMWGRDRDNVWTPRDAFSGSSQCRQGLLDMDIEQTRKIRELRRPDLARQDYFECWPHTVDPRGPKAETK